MCNETKKKCRKTRKKGKLSCHRCPERAKEENGKLWKHPNVLPRYNTRVLCASVFSIRALCVIAHDGKMLVTLWLFYIFLFTINININIFVLFKKFLILNDFCSIYFKDLFDHILSKIFILCILNIVIALHMSIYHSFVWLHRQLITISISTRHTMFVTLNIFLSIMNNSIFYVFLNIFAFKIYF